MVASGPLVDAHARNTNLQVFLAGGGVHGQPAARFGLLPQYRNSNYEHVWAFSCLNLLARTMSAVRWVLYEPNAGSDERVEIPLEKSPLLQRFARPNRRFYHSGRQFMQQLILYWLAGGNGFVLHDPIHDSFGVPVRFTAFGVRQVGPRRSGSSGLVDAWNLAVGAVRAIIARDQMSHIKFPVDPDSGELVMGVGPIRAAQRSLDIDFAAMVWNASLFRNGANVDTVLSYTPSRPQDVPWLSPQQATDVYEGWIADHKGAENAHGIHVLQGPFKLDRLGLSAHDLEFQDGRKMSRGEIAAALGVPMVLVDTENAGLTDAAVKVARRMLYENTVVPLLLILQDMLQVEFVDRYAPGLVGEFAYDEIPALRDDEQEKADLVTKYHAAGIPMNDLIDAYNLPFPKRPWNDTVFIPYTQSSVEDVLAGGGVPIRLTETGVAAEGDAPPTDRPTEPTDTIEAPAKKQAASVRRDVGRYVGRNGSRVKGRMRAARRTLFLRSWEPLEKKAQGRIKRHFVRLKGEMRDKLVALMSQEKLAASMRASAESKARRVLFDSSAAAKRLRAAMRPILSEAIGVGSRGGALELDSPPIVINSAINDLLLERQLGRITRVNDFVEQQVFDQLRTGFAEGENLTQLSDRLGGVMNQVAGDYHTLRIARTEVGGAVNGARFAEYKEQGVTRTEWLSADDELVRGNPENKHDSPYNHFIDGEDAAIGDVYSNGLEYPGDPNGDPGNIINCRCTTLPVVDNNEED